MQFFKKTISTMTKKFSLLYLLCGFLAISFMVTSCGDDTEDPGNGPTFTATLIGSSDLAPGTQFQVDLSGLQGDALLNAITYQLDGANLSTNDFEYQNITLGQQNPQLIADANDKQAFDWEVLITASNTPGNYEYTFILTDEDQLTTTRTISITVLGDAPTVTYNGTNLEVQTEEVFAISIVADKGTEDINSVAVYEDGTLISDASRLAYLDQSTTFDANPYIVPLADVEQINGAIYITAAAVGGQYTYTVEVEDVSGLKGSIDVTVDVNEGTPIDSTFRAVLVYNRDGQLEGGLDLDAGMRVRFDSDDAEIRDAGIDLNQPPADNWKQRILAVNNAELRSADNSQPELFDFENITIKEQIKAAFDAGNVISGESDKVAIDDIFIIKRDNNYYILKVADISVTTMNNSDFYEFDIKQALNF